MDADHLSKCVCGKRRLCVRCITVAGADRSETAQEKGDEASEGEQAAVQDGDEVSEGEQDHREDGLDEASEDEQLEDITDEPHWTAIRRCKWGYHPWCGHKFTLPYTNKQSVLATRVREHLQEKHIEGNMANFEGKWTCLWDDCSQQFTNKARVALHIVTAREHMHHGVRCPYCKLGCFREDSVKLHKKRCLSRPKPPSKIDSLHP